MEGPQLPKQQIVFHAVLLSHLIQIPFKITAISSVSDRDLHAHRQKDGAVEVGGGGRGALSSPCCSPSENISLLASTRIFFVIFFQVA